MPRFQTFGLGGEVTGFVDVDDAGGAAGGRELMRHHRYASDDDAPLALATDVQRATFIGFADRRYETFEQFEHRWAVSVGAVGVVFAEVALCKQTNPMTFANNAFLSVVAAADVSADIVTPGSYSATLEIANVPVEAPQFIEAGDPLWIAWSVTAAGAPSFLTSIADTGLSPLNAGAAIVGWIPSGEFGNSPTLFTLDLVTPIRGLTLAPFVPGPT